MALPFALLCHIITVRLLAEARRKTSFKDVTDCATQRSSTVQNTVNMSSSTSTYYYYYYYYY